MLADLVMGAQVTLTVRNLYRVLTTSYLLMVWLQLMRVVLLRAPLQPQERCIAGVQTHLVPWELTPQL
jgi:hypothetical protein